MDKQTIEDIAVLKTQMQAAAEEIETIKKDRAEWQRFCVRLVLKTGITLLGILTLGAFWGYLSPDAKRIVEGLLK